ncbi:fumarylacetoacetate hydrolase family protein [Bacteriovoracaceae bacterium]|nr:fumarylacetoacetate hydrolase family protein [Bacteriovoracaceae bacterium]
MEASTIDHYAKKLHDARIENSPIRQFKNDVKDFDVRSAYQIQEMGIDFRTESSEKIVGYKMGLTSEAKRKQMNLDSPLYGVLTDKMELQDQSDFCYSGLIHPKIEPEIAFLIGKDLKHTVSREEVCESLKGVYIAMEILDSRYEEFKYFSLEEVISDNSSSSHFVMGALKQDWSNLALDDLPMTLSINGESTQVGNSKAISGDPVQSVVQLVELLHQNNKILPAGSIVLAGAATQAVPLVGNMTITLDVPGFETVMVKVKE